MFWRWSSRAGRPARGRGDSLRVEALEDRQVLSVVPPVVVSVRTQQIATIPPHSQINITFSHNMNLALAQVASNYQVALPGPDGHFGSHNQFLLVEAASYNPLNRTVSVVTARPLPANVPFQLTVNGNFAGLADTAGIVLDGNLDGQPGGNFVTIVSNPQTLPKFFYSFIGRVHPFF
jgi:hypothetical protein